MTTKVTIIKNTDSDGKPMNEMDIGEICIVVEEGPYFGRYVMRTTDDSTGEVMDLSEFGKNKSWDKGCTLKVKPAPSGTKILFEVE